jgi:hypothetical protein
MISFWTGTELGGLIAYIIGSEKDWRAYEHIWASCKLLYVVAMLEIRKMRYKFTEGGK